jgi:hypothetical protein
MGLKLGVISQKLALPGVSARSQQSVSTVIEDSRPMHGTAQAHANDGWDTDSSCEPCSVLGHGAVLLENRGRQQNTLNPLKYAGFSLSRCSRALFRQQLGPPVQGPEQA